MQMFKGDMTIEALEKLVSKGYIVELDADSEYMTVTKAPLEAVEAILEA